MNPVHSKLLSAYDFIRHGFFTRQGGVSQGLYASLNCGPGSNDDPGHVRENRARVARHLGVTPDNLFSLYQVHGDTTIGMNKPWGIDERPEADAVVTRERGWALGILTADCTPVLFVDPKARVIGAAHAGWKGAVGAVLNNALGMMVQKGARISEVRAVIGPTIGWNSYEVGPDFPARFLDEDPAHARFFKPNPARPTHHLFNLPGYVKAKLERLGVAEVEDVGLDTLTDPDRFFSYRRTTLAQQADYGRQISAILLV